MLYPLKKNLLVPISDDFAAISNLGNRKGYKLLKRAYNARYRAEIWYSGKAFVFVLVDKRDKLEPVPFMFTSHADYCRKYSSASALYKRACKDYSLSHRETTHNYYRLQEVM